MSADAIARRAFVGYDVEQSLRAARQAVMAWTRLATTPELDRLAILRSQPARGRATMG